MKTAVRWRLKDLLDFPAADATIDVLDIPVDPNAPVRPQRMMFVVAARNSVIASRQQVFGSVKLGLSVIDIPEMAQRNISAMLEPEGRGLAMLSFDDDVALGQLLDPDHDRRLQSFDRITLELQRSLDNFERQFSFISVAKLVLGPSTLEGLDAYLSSNLYTPVDTLDLASILDLARAPELADKAQQQRFFLPLGAALRKEETAR
jgi:MSHA biogenesis protein MshI